VVRLFDRQEGPPGNAEVTPTAASLEMCMKLHKHLYDANDRILPVLQTVAADAVCIRQSMNLCLIRTTILIRMLLLVAYP
jgi:hypothetical protein